MTDPTPGTRPVTVQGREITIRNLIDTQYMLLGRCARILERPNVDKKEKLATVDRMFTILESVVVEADDVEYLEDLMAKGKLDLRELLSFATPEATVEEEAPKVRRGRTTAKRS